MKWLTRLVTKACSVNSNERRLNEIWQTGLSIPLFQGLSEDEWLRLINHADGFMSSRNWTPQEGLILDEKAIHIIALQACLPVFNLPEATLSSWSDLVIYPSAFVARDQWHDSIGVTHESQRILIGQARQEGPVLLSLPDALKSVELDGWNVVIHEIVHKLDMMNGEANGYPPLHKGMDRYTWAEDWSKAFAAFNFYLDSGVEHESWLWLDPYAAEGPAEFFAVISESFFEMPHVLLNRLPAVYRHLTEFYRQDPALRLPEIQKDYTVFVGKDG